jgi:uncharacterized ferritin-like protein (DUF455 family)
MSVAGAAPRDSGPATSLAEAARAIVATADLALKVRLAKDTAKAWLGRGLSLGQTSRDRPMPDEPGRPPRPVLLPPREMPKRSTGGLKGRIALLHSLAHIELSAVDMTWDLVGRFAYVPMPHTFFDNWVQVGLEEAKHFELLARRLNELGAAYGDLPAHAGLWQAAQATGDDLVARLAVVPLVLEARGLDVGPGMIEALRRDGDQPSADILAIIYRDEKRHVAFGFKWFRFLCERDGRPLEETFHQLVRRCFRGPIKPPFNDKARAEAGLTPGFYRPLASMAARR